MIKIPHIYSEWITIFDALKSKYNDEEVLIAMKKGKITWQDGVAERFTKKFIDAINYRMNMAVDKFQKDFTNSKGQDGLIVQSLLSLRKEFSYLSQVINLPAIPDKDREQYINLVRIQADKIQQSLEDSAKKDRTGKMLNTVRNHKI
jgi:hypothetical protein